MSDILERYRKVRREVEQEREAVMKRLDQIDRFLRGIDGALRNRRRRIQASTKQGQSSVGSVA